MRAGRNQANPAKGRQRPTSAPTMRQECGEETATSSTSERQLQLWRAASQETRDEYRRAAEGQTARRRNEERHARAQLMRDHKKRTAGRPQWQPPVVLDAGGFSDLCHARAPLGVASFRPQPAPPRGDGGAPPLPPPAPPNPNPTPNPNPNPNPNHGGIPSPPLSPWGCRESHGGPGGGGAAPPWGEGGAVEAEVEAPAGERRVYSEAGNYAQAVYTPEQQARLPQPQPHPQPQPQPQPQPRNVVPARAGSRRWRSWLASGSLLPRRRTLFLSPRLATARSTSPSPSTSQRYPTAWWRKARSSLSASPSTSSMRRSARARKSTRSRSPTSSASQTACSSTLRQSMARGTSANPSRATTAPNSLPGYPTSLGTARRQDATACGG